MSLEKKETETVTEWLARLDVEAQKSINNMVQIKEDMKRDGVIGFCPECGCNRYKDKPHTC